MATPSCTAIEACRTSDPVLLISPDPEDSALLREILASLGCRLESASGWHAAKSALRRDAFGLIVTERNLPDGDWRDVLSSLEHFSHPPLLIVISKLADECLWAEVLNQCGFDVLAKPLARDEVARVLGSALDTWNRSPAKWPAAISDSARHRRRAGGHTTGLTECGF